MKSKLLLIPPIPAVILSIISVQGGAAIAKTLFPAIGVETTASLRIGISALILLLAFRPKVSTFTKIQWRYVIPYGLVLGAMNIIFYMAIRRIPIGLGVTLEFVGPLALAILSSKKTIDFLWAILAIIGIALITPWTSNGLDLLGILLALLAGGFWALYIILGGKVSQKMSGGDAVAVGMLFATLLVLPFGIFSGDLAQVNLKYLAYGAALALLSSAIPFTLEINALKHLPAKTFSILMSLEPAAAALSGLVFLNEKLSFGESLAIALVIAASVGATLTSKKKTMEELPLDHKNPS